MSVSRTTAWALQVGAISCVAILFFMRSAFADSYSDGMKAYMQGDYELAQVQWLQAVKQNDAKAMFNLGLLHEQNKIASADQKKSENWYRLSGKHGYAAADFHLANLKLLNKGSENEVRVLLRRATSRGFAPAKKLLAKLKTGSDGTSLAVDLDAKIDESLLASVTEPTAKQPRIERYLTEDWITSKRSSDWTIQMLAFQDQAKVREFIDLHQLHSNAAYFVESNKGDRLYKLIYGAFNSKEQADAARQKLSTTLKEYGPWLRSIASVQQVIKQQQ